MNGNFAGFAGYRDRQGFSLVELIVVVSVMAIVTGFCVFGYLERADRTKLEGATSSIVSELRLAKMEAISKGINTDITLPVSSLYLQKESDLDGNGSISADEKELVKIQHATEVTVTPSGAGASFTGSGMFTAASLPWFVTVTSPRANHKYVYVFASGLVEKYDTLLSL